MKVICASLFLLMASLCAVAQTSQWARRGVSPGYEYGNALAVDDSGSVYFSGQIEYTTDFDGVSLRSFGIHDIVFGKYRSDGSIEWIRHAGSNAGDVSYGIGVDAAHNCYVTGEMERTADFGNGFSATTAGGNDIFLAKYDANGVAVRLNRWGTVGNDKGKALAVSPSGECYLTGYYSDGMTMGGVSLSHAGGSDFYVAKISAAGNVEWVKRGGGTRNDRGGAVAVDKSGNVFVAGYFTKSATFSGTTLTTNGSSGTFLAKYDSSGIFQWIKKGGSNDSDAEANGIAIDENGYIYVTGFYRGNADFGPYNFNSRGSSDNFLVKYDQSGDVVWAKSSGGSYEDMGNGVTVDTVNHLIYMTGQLDAHGYFDSQHITGAGNRDVFIAAYNEAGDVQWVKTYGGNNRDISFAIACDNNGNIFTTGIYNVSATFGTTTLTGDTISDLFVSKTSPRPADEPTTQVASISVTHENCSDLHLNFTGGNGSCRIVIARENSPVTEVPSDGISYTADSDFGSGYDLGGGNFVVYNGAGNECVLTGLTGGQTYCFTIYEYNGMLAMTNYLTTVPASSSEVSGILNVTINSTSSAICVGDTVSLIAVGAPVNNWFPASGLSSSTTDSVLAFPDTTTIYTLTGTDGSGCEAQASIEIIVNQKPVVSLTAMPAICENNPPVTLNGTPAGGVYSGTGISGNDFDPAISGTGVFMYEYEFTTAEGCTSSVSSDITVNPIPVVELGTDTMVCAGNFIDLNAGAGFQTYQWSNGRNTEFNLVDSSGVGVGSIELSVVVTDFNSCSNSDSLRITFDLCAGIENDLADWTNVFIYPNPFHQNFKLVSSDVIAFYLYDVTGQLLESGKSFTGEKVLGENYVPGIYFLKIVQDSKAKIIRLVRISD